MMASAAAAVEAVRRQRDDALTRGFEGELRRELHRSGAATAGPSLPTGPYTFQHYEAWNRPGLVPPPTEALKLLHRCVTQLTAAAGMAGGAAALDLKSGCAGEAVAAANVKLCKLVPWLLALLQ